MLSSGIFISLGKASPFSILKELQHVECDSSMPVPSKGKLGLELAPI